MSKHLRRVLAVVLLALIGFAVAGCESTAKPAALTGDEQAPTHERHNTGIESQANDM